MTQHTLDEKAQRCGSLLARSPLDEDIKNAILESLASLTVGDLDRLISSLEAEEREMKLLAGKLDDFDTAQDQAWSALEAAQKKRANDLVNEFSRSLEADIQEKIRAKLQEA